MILFDGCGKVPKAKSRGKRERSQAEREFREDGARRHVAPSVIVVINAILGKNAMED